MTTGVPATKSTAKPAKPLRRDAQRNRELLLVAARAVFAERGLDAPLDEIARRAGVSIGTLYNRFPTRVDLIDAACARLIERDLQIAEEALAEPDPWRGFADYLERSCQLIAGDRAHTDLCTRTFPAETAIEHGKIRMYELSRRLIDRAKEAGALRDDFADTDLVLAIVAVSRTAELTTAIGDRAWRRQLSLLLAGFRATEADSSREPAVTIQELVLTHPTGRRTETD